MNKRSLLLTIFSMAVLLCSAPSFAEQIATVDYDPEQDLQEYAKPYEGPRIVINVAARKLRLYDNDNKLVKTYPVAVGSASYRTPLGDREMTQIVWNPWWIPPKGSAWARNAKDTPPGPNNPLGPVKMKLGDAIMIHGTNKPTSVGHAASHGCMRMNSEEARELARYIQERVMLDTDVGTYDNYAKQNRRSFYVNLAQNVPVSLVYEIAEIENGQLHVYQDIYWRVRDKVAYVNSLLESGGYALDKLDLDSLHAEIRGAKNRQDLSFDIEGLKVAKRDKGGVETALRDD